MNDPPNTTGYTVSLLPLPLMTPPFFSSKGGESHSFVDSRLSLPKVHKTTLHLIAGLRTCTVPTGDGAQRGYLVIIMSLVGKGV